MPPLESGTPHDPQNILVVDDEQQVCDILAEALTFMGHTVRVAKDGLEALQVMEKFSFDIVVTDMDMPRMDGMELIRHLVTDRNAIDIIAITGHSMKYKYTDVVAAGAADFITKPFTLNELEAKLNRLIRERHLRRELERLATRDALTGLYNRRFFQRVVRSEAIRATRYLHPLFLFFVDIDRFKDFNDQTGHQAGDDLLVKLADVFRGSLREDVDTAFRYGGDEFTVLLPHLPAEQASVVAERLRRNFKELQFAPTSLSIGIGRFLSRSESIDLDVEDMIRRADMALYHAKHHLGRDCFFFDPESVG
ncbi:MAG: diguanylate cyclase [Syntrophobacteraceae bacterium]|nr:diguanylate cyclase [Desulfobacteraceae bacterium]